MILSVHAVAGGTTAALVTTNPVVGLCVGAATHYVLDVFPHWQYELSSKQGGTMNFDMKLGRAFVRDLGVTAADAILGLLILFGLAWWAGVAGLDVSFLTGSLLWGAIGGMLPDPLQFVYGKMPYQPLTALQRIHHVFHNDGWHTRIVLGNISQLCVVIWSAIMILAVV